MHRAAEWRPRPGGPGPLFLFCFQRCLQDWIEKMKKSNQLIMGIGHRIKSLANPDQRVGAQVQSHNGSCTKWRARWRSSRVSPRRNFNSTPVLDYALAVDPELSIHLSCVSAVCTSFRVPGKDPQTRGMGV